MENGNFRLENVKKAQRANKLKKPEVLYECPDYIIERIPYNYKATILCASDKYGKLASSMDREIYSHPEHGLDHIKELVEAQIGCWFAPGVKVKKKFLKKK